MRWYIQDTEDKYTTRIKNITAHKQYRPSMLRKIKQEMENIVIAFDMTSEYESISRLLEYVLVASFRCQIRSSSPLP